MDGLAPAVIWHAEHRHLVHGGVAADRLLDLARVDVDPAGDDHVVLAVDDVEVALLIAPGQVAD